MTRPMEPTHDLVPAIARMDAIFSRLQSSEDGITLSALTRDTGIAKTTCLRLLRQLTAMAFVRFDEHSNRYSLGVRLLVLGEAAARSFDWTSIARDECSKLASVVKLPVKISMILGRDVTLVLKVDPPQPMYVSVRTGGTFPLHAGAASKVLLSQMPSSEFVRLLTPELERFTDKTIVRREELLREVESVRAAGFAVDHGEFVDGIMAVAVPLQLVDTKASLSVPFIGRTESASFIDELLPHVRQTAASIEEKLRAGHSME